MADLERELKELIVSALNLEDITPDDIESDEPLFGKGLGLDSIDGLELGVAIRKEIRNQSAGNKGRNPRDIRDGAQHRALSRRAGVALMVSKEDIEAVLSRYLQDLFDLPAEKITPDARLAEDLDLDSIDAVDLVVKLQEYTGKKILPSEFKTVRTIGDVVDKIYAQVNNGVRS